MFAKNLDSRGIRCEVSFDGVTVDYVLGDELRISQIIINFLSNAVKFTSEGEIIVTFRQMMLRNGVADMMIRVHDTGIGMEPAFISRIFRPFEQETVETSRKYGGTGLSMAITDQLVKLMGGNSGAANPAKPDTSNTPGEPSAPGNNKLSKPGSGSSVNTNGGGTAAPPSVQGGSIANTMQDPDSGKTGAGVIGEQDPSSKPYYEGNVDDSTVQEVVIQQPQNSSGETDPSALYAGQKNITARKIYNALETYVKDSNGKTYYWSNLKDANGNDVHFGVFVRINGIRIGDTFFGFLNEATGEYDKTLDEIPSDATEIKISASYRLSEGSAWKDYADITYTLKRNRIFTSTAG